MTIPTSRRPSTPPAGSLWAVASSPAQSRSSSKTSWRCCRYVVCGVWCSCLPPPLPLPPSLSPSPSLLISLSRSIPALPCPALPWQRTNATQCHATKRNATQRNATQCNATQRNTTRRDATQHNTTQHKRPSKGTRGIFQSSSLVHLWTEGRDERKPRFDTRGPAARDLNAHRAYIICIFYV